MPEDLLNDNTALGWVRLEHARVEGLLKSCLENPEPAFVAQATNALIRELDIHAATENEFMLPFLQQSLPTDKFHRAIRHNADVETLKTKLASLKPEDPDYYPTVNQLALQFERHMYDEEEFGFVPLEMHNVDVQYRLERLADAMDRRRAGMLQRARDLPPQKAASVKARSEHEAALEQPADSTALEDGPDGHELRPS